MNKRDDIVKAALTEFSKNDFENASINKIIKEANTSKGNFYHYFKDKEELYMMLVNDAFQKKMKVMTSIETDNLFTLLEAQVINGVEFAKKNPKYYQLSRRFIREKGSPIYDKVIDEIVSKYELESIDAIIEKSYSSLVISNEYPINFVKKVIYFVLENLNDLVIDENIDLSEVEAKLVLIIKFLKNGLCT